jgi:DEAD/DEAH box helicase domain-containing protein
MSTGLLEKDPIGAFKQINEMYLKYLQSAFKTRYKQIEDQRMQLLQQNGNAYQDPYIEILPEYKECDNGEINDWTYDSFRDCFIDKPQFKIFIKLITAGLIDAAIVPYTHQVNMLREGIINGRAVVTSGTGSGKTEAFMMPLIANILKEAKSWDSPSTVSQALKDQINTICNSNDGLENFEYSRGQEKRPAAIRAIVLYPMNALVADQMVRMRKALDSDAAREVYKTDYFKGNKIYFGRYNSEALPTGKNLADYLPDRNDQKRLKYKINDVVNELRKFYKQAQNNREVINVLGESPELQKQIKNDTEFIYPRLSSLIDDEVKISSELLSRWDMQEYPPDILITNYSMLNIMLMRRAEEGMFEKTKQWLNCEDEFTIDKTKEEKAELKKLRKIHIVLDELHLYRGAAGTEIAYLIRCIYHKLGLEPVIDGQPNEQLRILCSSASLGQEDQTKQFLSDFFDLPETSFTEIKGEPKYYKDNYIDCAETLDPYFNTLLDDNFNPEDFDLDSDLFKKIVYKSLYNVGEDSIKPKSILDLSKILFPTFENNEKNQLLKVLRNLLIWRGGLTDNSLPRFRFHNFYKFIEGMWAELPSGIINKETSEDEFNLVNQIHFTPRIVGEAGNKVLELLRCEQCNTLFYGGEKTIDSDDDGGSIITLGIENTKLEQIPGKSGQTMAQNKKFNEYGVFWPFETIAPEIVDGINNFINNPNTPLSWLPNEHTINDHRRSAWYKSVLNIKTGQIRRGDVKNGNANLIEGYFYTICNDQNPNIINDSTVSNFSAIPNCCPGCGSNFEKRTYSKSPIKNFRAGLDQSNQLLSKELFYQLKEKYSSDQSILLEGRKLVSFTDSREESAKQAFGTEREHFRLLVQELMMKEIENSQIKDDARIKLALLEQIEIELRVADDKDEKQNELNDEYRDYDSEIEIIRNYIERPAISLRAAAYNNLFNPIKNQVAADFVQLKDLINGLDNQPMGPIVQKLLGLGINPLGVGKEFETIELIRDGNVEKHPWFKLFDLVGLGVNVAFLETFNELHFHSAIDEEDTNVQKEIIIQGGNGWEIKLLNYIFHTLKIFLSKEALFKTYVFGIENSGLGYAMFHPDKVDEILSLMGNGFDELKTEDAKPHIHNLLNSILRVCGNNFYYSGQESGHAAYASAIYFLNSIDQNNTLNKNQKDAIKSSNNKLKKFIESYSQHNPFNRNDLDYWMDFIFKILIGPAENDERKGLFKTANGVVQMFNNDGIVSHKIWYIDLDKIVIKKVNAEAPVYRNNLTKRVHLFHTHSALNNNEVGICTFSFTPNVSITEEIASHLWETNHISYPVKFLERPPIRLHTAELTGQTDDQLTVQNEFKGIVDLDNTAIDLVTYQAMRKRQEVDIINVTTTMEVGIDIGSLQAIFQGNMPPTRYNYQQRVGRGGRRGQAYSAAVTFCRGRSHDLFYYNYGLDKITGDIPTPPAINIYKPDNNLDVKSIVKRMIIRTIMGQAFKSFELTYNELDNSDNHGEFGYVVDYVNTNKSNLENWIAENEGDIIHTIRYFVDDRDNYFVNCIKNDLINEINMILFNDDGTNKTNQTSLAQALAEGGMLPMFGMPSAVREFYHSFSLNHKTNQREIKSMSRDIEMAISEFAPGQIRTKDKAKYISRGLTQTLVNNYGNLKYMFNKVEPLSNRINLTAEESAAYNLNPNTPTIIPIAFRTDTLINNVGDRIDADDTVSSFSKIEILPRPSNIKNSIREVNANLKIRFNNVDSYPKILKLNTNNSRGFRLSRTNVEGLNNEYLDRANNANDYYLGFEKVTNLIGLIPNSDLLGTSLINVNPFDQNGRISWENAGRAAAIYSAAFILQAIVAEELDIAPNEIEISPIQKYLDENLNISVPEIFLSDNLANGSGFVSFLNDNFNDLLTKLFNGEYKIYESLLSDERALKYFYNQSFHPIIDPLLGLSYLRLLSNTLYKAGAVDSDSLFDEVNNIKDKMKLAGSIFQASFPEFELKNYDNKIFYLEKENKKYVITHPFWNTDYQEDDSALFRFGNFGVNLATDIKYLDYFNMLHRPLFVYNNLLR